MYLMNVYYTFNFIYIKMYIGYMFIENKKF